MPYITKKGFERSLKSCKIYLKTMGYIKPLPKEKYPKMGEETEFHKGDVIKLKIDKKNNTNKNHYENLREEIKWGKKNLDDLINSKKESIFRLIQYNKIYTLNWGKVNLPEFVEYLKKGVEIYETALLGDGF